MNHDTYLEGIPGSEVSTGDTEPEARDLVADNLRLEAANQQLEAIRASLLEEVNALSHDLKKVQTEADEDDQEIKRLAVENMRLKSDLVGAIALLRRIDDGESSLALKIAIKSVLRAAPNI